MQPGTSKFTNAAAHSLVSFITYCRRAGFLTSMQVRDTLEYTPREGLQLIVRGPVPINTSRPRFAFGSNGLHGVNLEQTDSTQNGEDELVSGEIAKIGLRANVSVSFCLGYTCKYGDRQLVPGIYDLHTLCPSLPRTRNVSNGDHTSTRGAQGQAADNRFHQ